MITFAQDGNKIRVTVRNVHTSIQRNMFRIASRICNALYRNIILVLMVTPYLKVVGIIRSQIKRIGHIVSRASVAMFVVSRIISPQLYGSSILLVGYQRFIALLLPFLYSRRIGIIRNFLLHVFEHIIGKADTSIVVVNGLW